jgi:SmpA / OmlA family
MKTYIFRVLICLLLPLLTSCGLIGYARLNPEKVAQIKKGVTTQSQVETLLGRPSVRSNNADGTVTLGYGGSAIRSLLPGTMPSVRMLFVKVGRSGKVTGYQYSDNIGRFMGLDSHKYQVGPSVIPNFP